MFAALVRIVIGEDLRESLVDLGRHCMRPHSQPHRCLGARLLV